jgi:hypothetical protein
VLPSDKNEYVVVGCPMFLNRVLQPVSITEETLASAKVILVDPLPMPPLSSMGLGRFADFVRGDFEGITYMDTVFLKPSQSDNENLYFHELVHVIQWRLLGSDRFL